MKKTIICIALATVMALGLGSVAFAETYDPGTNTGDGSDTIITVEVAETPPVNISATVPVELPFVVVHDTTAGNEANGVVTYYPQDGWYGVTNTCENVDADTGDPVDVSIRVTKVAVSHYDPMETTWTLVPAADVATPATDGKNTMNITLGGVELPALGPNVTIAKQVERPETPGGEAIWKDIAQDVKLSIPVTAKAGGTNADYTENVAKANTFKVVYTLGRTPVVAP